MGLREIISPIKERLANVVIFQTQIPSSTYEALNEDAKSHNARFTDYTMSYLFPPMLRAKQLVLEGWRSVPVYDLTNQKIKQLFNSGDETVTKHHKAKSVSVQFAMRVSDYRTFFTLAKRLYPKENETHAQYYLLIDLVTKWMRHRVVLTAPGSVYYKKGDHELEFPQLDLH